MYPKVGVATFVKKWDQFLLWKRASGFWKWTWCIPWWHLDFWESFEDCVRRETFEETNVFIKNVNFLWVNNDIIEDKHFVTICMFAEYDSWEPSVENDNEFDELIWTSLDLLPQKLFIPFDNILKNFGSKINAKFIW